jgi:hypothetical protein
MNPASANLFMMSFRPLCWPQYAKNYTTRQANYAKNYIKNSQTPAGNPAGACNKAYLDIRGEAHSRSNADLQALTQRLENLAELYKSLEALLPRVNGLLNGR